jgi:hypothetical protein
MGTLPVDGIDVCGVVTVLAEVADGGNWKMVRILVATVC